VLESEVGSWGFRIAGRAERPHRSAVYLVVGLSMLRLFEFEGRRSATLEAF
jgi:hypothetical protein